MAGKKEEAEAWSIFSYDGKAHKVQGKIFHFNKAIVNGETHHVWMFSK